MTAARRTEGADDDLHAPRADDCAAGWPDFEAAERGAMKLAAAVVVVSVALLATVCALVARYAERAFVYAFTIVAGLCFGLATVGAMGCDGGEVAVIAAAAAEATTPAPEVGDLFWFGHSIMRVERVADRRVLARPVCAESNPANDSTARTFWEFEVTDDPPPTADGIKLSLQECNEERARLGFLPVEIDLPEPAPTAEPTLEQRVCIDHMWHGFPSRECCRGNANGNGCGCRIEWCPKPATGESLDTERDAARLGHGFALVEDFSCLVWVEGDERPCTPEEREAHASW